MNFYKHGILCNSQRQLLFGSQEQLCFHPILYLGPRLSKEATDFTCEGDSILVLESSDRVDEHLDKIRLVIYNVKLVILI